MLINVNGYGKRYIVVLMLATLDFWVNYFSFVIYHCSLLVSLLCKNVTLFSAFKLCASRGCRVVSNSQAVRGLGNLLGKLESYQRGFNWNIPFKCRRLKPWELSFSREYQKSGKAGRFLFFVGVDVQEMPGGTPEVWSWPCVCQLPSSWLCHGQNSSR